MSYLPVLTYLTVVSILLFARRGHRKPVPFWIHPAAVAGGLVVRVVTDGLTGPVLGPVGVAAVLFLAFLLLDKVGSMLTPTGMLSVIGAVALTPLGGLPWLVAGLVIAAGVAVWKVARVAGMARVNMVASETLMASGINPAGSLRKPSAHTLITAEDTEKFLAQATDAAKAQRNARMYLPPYLLGGAILGLLVVLL